jgi:hypothetical protein
MQRGKRVWTPSSLTTLSRTLGTTYTLATLSRASWARDCPRQVCTRGCVVGTAVLAMMCASALPLRSHPAGALGLSLELVHGVQPTRAAGGAVAVAVQPRGHFLLSEGHPRTARRHQDVQVCARQPHAPLPPCACSRVILTRFLSTRRFETYEAACGVANQLDIVTLQLGPTRGLADHKVRGTWDVPPAPEASPPWRGVGCDPLHCGIPADMPVHGGALPGDAPRLETAPAEIHPAADIPWPRTRTRPRQWPARSAR